MPMMIFRVLLFLILLPFTTKAQLPFAQAVGEDTCLFYQPHAGTGYLFIPSSFGRDQVFQHRLEDSLRNKTILKIDLAYTLFKADKNFDQHQLNRMRWQALHHRFPVLFANEATVLHNVCQTLATEAGTARQMSHGFYVYYRSTSDSLGREKEIALVEDFIARLEKKETGGLIKKTTDTIDRYTEATRNRPKKTRVFKPVRRLKDRKACRSPFYGNGDHDLVSHFNQHTVYAFRRKKKESATLLLVLNKNGEISEFGFTRYSRPQFRDAVEQAVLLLGDWHGAYYKGRSIKSVIQLQVQASAASGYTVTKTLIDPLKTISCGEVPDDSIFMPQTPAEKQAGESGLFLTGSENLLQQVLERNGPFRNTLFALDVTGSMSVYIMESLQLLHDSISKQRAGVKWVVLFNDGDNRNDRHKRVGNTGGLYETGDTDITRLARFVVRAMRNGNGGDCPENNIEALLQGIQSCPGCTDIVMIADNYASPRDAALIHQVKQPVHWILCGTQWGVNPAYLDLIRANRGYGHTVSGDFKDLHLLKEGDTVEVDGLVYELKNDKFVRKAE